MKCKKDISIYWLFKSRCVTRINYTYYHKIIYVDESVNILVGTTDDRTSIHTVVLIFRNGVQKIVNVLLDQNNTAPVVLYTHTHTLYIYIYAHIHIHQVYNFCISLNIFSIHTSPLPSGERSINPVCLDFPPVFDYQMWDANRIQYPSHETSRFMSLSDN